jgi:hypothetical protein
MPTTPMDHHHGDYALALALQDMQRTHNYYRSVICAPSAASVP